MKHLSPEELVDLAEKPETGQAAHLDECVKCREQVALLRSVLSEARHVQIPEPSPLFWEHFSARVRKAIAPEATPVARFAWSGWQLGAGAAALIALAAVATVRLRAPAAPVATSGSASVAVPAVDTGAKGSSASNSRVVDLDADVADEDASWLLMADLTTQVDVDAPGNDLLIRSDAAEHAIPYLSDEDRRALGEVLQNELGQSSS